MARVDDGALRAIRGALGDLGRNLITRPDFRSAVRKEFRLIPNALRHTVPWLVRAKGENDANLVKVILDNAKVDPFGLALSWLSTFCSDGESSNMPMCATGSFGHWFCTVMFVTLDPLRNAFV